MNDGGYSFLKMKNDNSLWGLVQSEQIKKYLKTTV